MSRNLVEIVRRHHEAGAPTAAEVLKEAMEAEARARGGAGLPAGLRSAFARSAPGERRCIVANGDEGDPGSCKVLAVDVRPVAEQASRTPAIAAAS